MTPTLCPTCGVPSELSTHDLVVCVRNLSSRIAALEAERAGNSPTSSESSRKLADGWFSVDGSGWVCTHQEHKDPHPGRLAMWGRGRDGACYAHAESMGVFAPAPAESPGDVAAVDRSYLSDNWDRVTSDSASPPVAAAPSAEAEECLGCAKVRRHPGEGYECGLHPQPAAAPAPAPMECPFYNEPAHGDSNPRIVDGTHIYTVCVECQPCGARGPMIAYSVPTNNDKERASRSAIEEWNKAPREAVEAALREELESLSDRIRTIADEANGPHPVQSADAAMTCIERALFEGRAENEKLRKARGERAVAGGSLLERANAHHRPRWLSPRYVSPAREVTVLGELQWPSDNEGKAVRDGK
jgi:hypothetical protein